MANISSFAEDVYPALTKMIFDEMDRYPEMYPRIFNVESTDRWYDEQFSEVGYGLFAETGDQETYNQDDMYPGFYTRFRQVKYTKYFRVSEDLINFERYIEMGRRAKDLGQKAQITRETIAASVYNNAYTSTATFDGQPLFSTAHPGYPGSGQSFSNRLTNSASLCFTAYQQVLANLKTTVDERGILIMQIPKTLVVHPQNEVVAREILNSAGRPDTANNASNELKNVFKGVDLFVYPFLTSPTMWFVICDTFYVFSYEFEKLKIRHETDPFNGDNMVFGRFYQAVGASHYLGLYAGSN